jgi:predicted RNA-binding Zn ribbon-like protein
MDLPNPAILGSKAAAGELCLDFTNTVEWHASNHPEERLITYVDLVTWSGRAGLLTKIDSRRLLREAARRPRAAAATLKRAIRMREAIYRIAVGLVRKRPPASSDIAMLNRALASALPHLRLRRRGAELVWIWEGSEQALDRMLWPILRSAAGLFTSDRRHRVGQCADDRGCGWLFVDRTKNRSRRWCFMEDCGNRAKARRHYERGRQRGPGIKGVDRNKQG